MAQPSSHPPPQQQRSQFSPTPQRDFALPNGRPSSFNAGSPPVNATYSSPSPQQYSPQFSNAPPPAKRPRVASEVASPLSIPGYPSASSPQPVSPLPGTPVISTPTASRSAQGLMAPPQRPADKPEQDRSYNDILSGTGVSLEEEERNLARQDFYSQHTPQSSFQSTNGVATSFAVGSFTQPSGTPTDSFASLPDSQVQVSEADRLRREHERADWEASRHSQHVLWDLFLFGGNLNEKIKKLSNTEHLVDPQAGVMVNTQRNAPPPVVRVNGFEGASRVIDRGQSILDTREKADRLSDLMKLVSLATKTRLTGLVNASAKLAVERQKHSAGKIPNEWSDIAVPMKRPADAQDTSNVATDSKSLKRSHAQMNGEDAPPSTSHPAVQAFDQSSQESKAAEVARNARRARRRAKLENKDVDGTADADADIQAALDAEKKMNKKERKAAETKFSEQQQHKYANEAARMATSGLLGNRFGGKKGKSYSWMTGGGGGGTASSTPVKSAASTPAPGTPASSKTPAVPRGHLFQQWDESLDLTVTARDVIHVLESDGQAARSYVKASSSQDM